MDDRAERGVGGDEVREIFN